MQGNLEGLSPNGPDGCNECRKDIAHILSDIIAFKGRIPREK